MVEARPLSKLPEVLAFAPRRFGDDRGYFSETFRDAWFEAAGVSVRFCQDNQSHSAQAGTVRGLHFQNAPHAQGKLVRVLSGGVYDVAVDIRPGSATFGQWDGLELTADGGEQLYIPPGFAHGFMTLSDNCLVAYKCTAYYNKEAEGSIAFADPDLGIEWPTLATPAILSEKDAAAPSFAALKESL